MSLPGPPKVVNDRCPIRTRVLRVMFSMALLDANELDANELDGNEEQK
jgi:hypothetical protein